MICVSLPGWCRGKFRICRRSLRRYLIRLQLLGQVRLMLHGRRADSALIAGLVIFVSFLVLHGVV